MTDSRPDSHPRRSVALSPSDLVVRLSLFDRGAHIEQSTHFNPEPPPNRKPWFKTNGFKLIAGLAIAAGIVSTANNALNENIAPTVIEQSLPVLVDASGVRPKEDSWFYERFLAKRSVAPITSEKVAEAPFVLPAFDIAQLTTSNRMLEEIKTVEQLRLKAYQDLGAQGIWTIGYGHTGLMPDGTPVSRGDTITQAQADAIFALDVERHAQDVREAVKVPVTQEMFDALVNFHFNTGAINSSTLTKELNEGSYSEAAKQFLEWVYVTRTDDNGKKYKEQHPGLTERANFNKDYFSEGIPIALTEGMKKHGVAHNVLLAENRADRTSKRLTPLPRLGDIESRGTQRALAKTLDRSQKHIDELTHLLQTNKAMLDTLDKDRLSLLASIRQTMKSGDTSNHNANDVLQNKIQRLHVINQVTNDYRRIHTSSLQELEYYQATQEMIGSVLKSGMALAQLDTNTNKASGPEKDLIIDEAIDVRASLEVFEVNIGENLPQGRGAVKDLIPEKAVSSMLASLDEKIDKHEAYSQNLAYRQTN